MSAFLMCAGTIFVAGCNNDSDDDSGHEKVSASSTEKKHTDKQVRAVHEERKEQLSSDRAFHKRYDRNYDDQFEAPH